MPGSPPSSIVTDDARPQGPVQASGATRPAAGDGVAAAGISGGAGGTSGIGRWAWLRADRGFWLPCAAIAVILTGVCTVEGFTMLRDYARLGRPLAPWQSFLFAYSSLLLLLLAAPLVYAMLRRHPLRGRRLPLDLLAHGLASLVFSGLHVAGMVGLRKLVYALMGETYLFGFNGSNFLYEYRKDLMTYIVMLAIFWLLGRLLALERALAERRAAQEPAAEAGILALRDGATTLRVKAADILWAAAAGNYVEFALADGRKPLIRGTLQGFEATLAAHGFLRVHRSRLVNAARVAAMESKESGDFTLSLDDGSKLAGSRRYRDGLKALGR